MIIRFRFTGRRACAFAAWLILTATIGPAAVDAQSNPGRYQQNGDARGFLNILPPGSDGTLNGPEATAAQGGRIPPYFQDQLIMYDNLVYNSPGLTDDQVLNFFKDASFGVRPDDILREYQPGGRTDVTVIRDASYGVPHVFGDTREGTMFASGYVAAEDRLFLMDLLRHVGRARMTEFLGGAQPNIDMDREQLAVAPYLESDYTVMLNAAVSSAGADGPVILADVTAYSEGITAYINEAIADPDKMPAEYAALQLTPDPWIPEDTIAVAVLVGAIFGKGGGRELRNHCGLKELATTLGSAAAARTVFDDLKFADDAEAPTSSPDTFPYMSNMGAPDPAAHPDVDCDSLFPIDDGSGSVLPPPTGSSTTSSRSASGLPDGKALLEKALDAIEHGPKIFGATPSSMSNALLISGDHTDNGRPIAVFGPQTGYFAPQLLVEKDLHGPGIDARGVSFAGTGIYIELGRGRDFAFSATSASGDNVDQWVLILCEPGGGPATVNSMGYMRNSVCEPIEEFVHQQVAKPGAAGQPGIPETACDNAIDDDNDGFVNDGCPPDGLPELATQCLNAIDDDGDGKVNDGCPPIAGNDIVLEWTVQRSAHYGPLVSRGTLTNGTPIAIATQRSTYLNELGSARGFYQINNPDFMTNGVQSFRDAMGKGVDYTFNWFYVDATDIAYQHSCMCPQRAAGSDPYLPTIGDGTHDWQGFISFAEQPFSINPAQGYLSSWNNKQAPGFLSNDGNFDYGPVYRNLMLDSRLLPLVAAGGAARTDMIDAMEDAGTTDLRGQEALQLLLDVMGPTSPVGSDPRSQDMRNRMAAWLTTDTHRRDFDKSGEYDDPQAAAIMDTWWKDLAHAMFDTESGNAIGAIGIGLEDANRRKHIGSAFQGAFVSQVQKDLRQILGLSVTDPMSKTYCGAGVLQDCSNALWAAMDSAAVKLEAEFGSPDVANWKRTIADEEVRHTVAGIVGVPAMHWINRPTFQQVVQLGDAGSFKCYKSKNGPGTPKFAKTAVQITDAFGLDAATAVKPESFCSAAGFNGGAPGDAAANLACYRIKSSAPRDDSVLTVSNLFGAPTLTRFKPRSVCVPTSLDAVAPPAALDAFKCYKAKRAKGSAKPVKTEVSVLDAFEDKAMVAIKPHLFCQSAAIDAGSIVDSAGALTCYKTKRAKGVSRFAGSTEDTTNLFGSETQSLIKPRYLCVQSQKTVAP